MHVERRGQIKAKGGNVFFSAQLTQMQETSLKRDPQIEIKAGG